MRCSDTSVFLQNLVSINQRAGVHPDIVDLVESYATLRLAHNREIDFYNAARPISTGNKTLQEFLSKNSHLDVRARNFITAYWQEMQASRLCCIFSCSHLAHHLKTPLDELYSLSKERTKNYHIFTIKKSSGTDREIQAPNRKLKAVQRNILDTVLYHVPLNNYAEGFRKNRSIITNAVHHVNNRVLVKLDIQDFFPTIDLKRVKGMYLRLGYPRQVATLLSHLATHQGKLPTGAPTSPAIANIISRKLDKRFVNLGRKTGFVYSRYADDMTISGDDEKIVKMIPFFREIIRDEGFTLNERKIRIMRGGRRQTVTGVVVNQKPNIARQEIKKLRAVLHNCKHGNLNEQTAIWAKKKKGMSSAHAYSITDFRRSLQAKIHFLKMVNEPAGEKLLAEFHSVAWPS